jgi:hypothetical protein
VTVLERLVTEVDPTLRPYAVEQPPEGEWETRLPGTRGEVMEAVYEGFLMHYGEPRAFAGLDPDLRLLAGDALYALGLEKLARAGDLEAVTELSDLISACARAQAEGRPTRGLWEASLSALSA